MHLFLHEIPYIRGFCGLCGFFGFAVFIGFAATAPSLAQFVAVGEDAGGLRLYEDGAAGVALSGGLEITLGSEIVQPLDAALASADGAALVERIEQLVQAYARDDASLAAAIGRYAAQRDPARQEIVSLGVLRGNPGASRLLLDNLGPQAGEALAGDPLQGAGTRQDQGREAGFAVQPQVNGSQANGVFANASGGGDSGLDGLTAGASSGRSQAGFGQSAAASPGGFSSASPSNGRVQDSGSGRFQAPRRSLFSATTAIVEPPPSGFASPSLP
jgi:hypothetical protein